MKTLPNTVKPIITGLGEPIIIHLSKMIDCAERNIVVKCPVCNNEHTYLNDSYDLEYGEFYTTDECEECGTAFGNLKYNVVSYVVINLEGGK